MLVIAAAVAVFTHSGIVHAIEPGAEPAPPAELVPLSDALAEFSAVHGVNFVGLDRTAGVSVTPQQEGSVAEQLRHLLREFNYAAIGRAGHLPNRIIITGRAAAPADGRSASSGGTEHPNGVLVVTILGDGRRPQYHGDNVTPIAAFAGGPELLPPLAHGHLVSGYGPRAHPILGYLRMHRGVDIKAAHGTPVLAAAEGHVADAGWRSGYGNFVRIGHGQGLETLYGHLSRFPVKLAVGARVEQGQVIGYVGASGLANGPHLHYELRLGGRSVDPTRFAVVPEFHTASWNGANNGDVNPPKGRNEPSSVPWPGAL